MKSTDKRIIEIAEKYENKIHQEFGEHVNFSKVDDMITNVLIVDREFMIKQFNLPNAAAVTDEKDKHIYINEETFLEERIMVHEYIHRISTTHIPFLYHRSGIKDNHNNHFAFNELITEYMCYKITGVISKTSAYGQLSFVFDLFDDIFGIEKIKDVYFKHKSSFLPRKMGRKQYKIANDAAYCVMVQYMCQSTFKMEKLLITEAFNSVNRQ